MVAATGLLSCHHEVFAKFHPREDEGQSQYHVDFLGARTHGRFVAGLPLVQNRSIPVYVEYFEWFDLLESVLAARGSYTMLDLGAGYGRWAVRAALALRQYNQHLPCRLVAVEAEPLAFQWIRSHFIDNGIDPTKHSLIHAAVCDNPHDVWYYIRGPRNGRFDRGPDEWSGQRITKGYDVNSQSLGDGEYCGLKVQRHASGWRSVRVPNVTIATVIPVFDC